MTQTPPSSLQLLGTFQLLHHEEVVNLGQARLEELVAFLALYPGKPFTRSQIAYLFWPDSKEQQARTNVRNLLYKLKQAWPKLHNAITVDRRLVMWHSDADIVVDVQNFKNLLGRAEECKVPDERVRLLAEAAAQVQGDLLPDCYSDWILPEREQLRSHYAAALEAWIGGLLELRRYDEALTQAQRLRDHPSNKVAKSVIDFSITVPRERLRPNYGDGFQGAPLQPALLSKCKTERKRGANRDEPQPARERKTAGKTHL